MNEFLKDLSHELNTQDNRITANPLYVVQQKRRVYGEDMCNPTGSIFVLSCDPSLAQWNSLDEAIDEMLSGSGEQLSESDFDEIQYEEFWVFVTAHLTERAADLYIEQNRHNLISPRVYVTSQYRCHEFNRLIDYLKGVEHDE